MRGTIMMKQNLRGMTALILILMLPVAGASAEEKFFSLEDAFQAALTTSEYVQVSQESIAQSQSRIDQALTYLYPRVVAQSAYTRYDDTLPPGGGPVIFQPQGQLRAALVLTQPLYTGGRTFAALRTTERMLEVSKKGLTVAQQNVMIMVAEAYYGVIKAQKSIEISRHSLERIEHHKKVTEQEAATRRTKAGMSALLRANSLVTQAKINLVRAEDGLTIAREKLNMLTKLPTDVQLSEPQPVVLPDKELAQLKSIALATREDYASSKLSQNIASENITIVRGGHYPQVYAETGMTYVTSSPATMLDATSYYAGLRLQIPIFEGGLMKSEVSEAKSKLRQAELATNALKRSIESEVHEAFVNFQTISSVLETAKLQLSYAKDNFVAVEGLFAEGLVPSLSIIDAEQALSFSERELMNATYDQQLALIRLKKSIGALNK